MPICSDKTFYKTIHKNYKIFICELMVKLGFRIVVAGKIRH